MIPNKHRSPERLSPELLEKIQRRWGVVYRATENEHRGERAVYSDIDVIALPPARPARTVQPAAKAADTRLAATNVIDLTARREQAEQAERERLIAEARTATQQAIELAKQTLTETDELSNADYIDAISEPDEMAIVTEEEVKPAKDAPDAAAA